MRQLPCRLVTVAALLGILQHAAFGQTADRGWSGPVGPAGTQYRAVKNQVVGVRHITQRCVNSPNMEFAGKVVKVEYAKDALTIIGFVFEDEEDRHYVNVDSPSPATPGMNMADLGWLRKGIAGIIREGQRIEGHFTMCGAAGRVWEALDVANPTGNPAPKPVVATPPITPKPDVSAPVVAATHSEVPLVEDGGTYKVPATINGALTLDFTVDSGASDVSVPADVVMTLMRTGTLRNEDFTGSRTYVLADGSKVPSQTFLIRTLKVGDKILNDVTASVARVEGSLLLGQAFLSRFHQVSFDYSRKVLILN